MNFKIKPWQHQLDVLERTRNKDHYALFWEVGTGKTFAMVSILRQKYIEAGTLLNTLIFCPIIVVENWKREILKYSDIEHSYITPLMGSAKKRIKTFDKAIQTHGQIVVTNYETLLMKELFDRFLEWGPQCVILDESHKCKDLKAKRTKSVVKLGRNARYKFILSGTPVTNSLFDVFSQYLFLDNGQTFGSNFVKFRREYFTDLNKNRPRQSYFPLWVPKENTSKRINFKLFHKAMRVKKEECLDLPPLVHQMVSFEMAPAQRKIYHQMERDCITYLNDTVISADLAIKKAMKLHQITNNFLINDEEKLQEWGQNPRIEALKEIISLIPKTEKFIVWCVFKYNYHCVRKLLHSMNILWGEIHGSIKMADRQLAIDSFNDSAHPMRAIIAHPKAGGIGINLTTASYSIFYSHNFSLEDNLQAEARNYRGGSEIHKKITRIDIVASNSIDETIVTALRNKKDVSETVLNQLKGKEK